MPRRPGDGPWNAPAPPTVHDTSGVQVRIGSRSDRHRARREQERQGGGGRRLGLILGGVSIAVAAAVAVGVLLMMPGGDDGGVAPSGPAGASTGGTGAMPKTGSPVDVATADGSKYRIAAVGAGSGAGVSTQQAGAAGGSKVAYIEYVLSNPSQQKVLLDFPGDVFVKRDMVGASARGRCMWQAGVPEDMCTPPTSSDVVRKLKGGDLVAGDGGDKYMPPGSSFLVRATVGVPVDRRLGRNDLRLYIWKKLYVPDQYARLAAFPG
ncbi:hypothetical protein [Actinomadura parmotrematis]|uniref:Serine/threonine protein kinase n=1 Tax=Actinomadura parmotrematis TaxID=2864039 RepID=A0ABS7G625_9ACTN|nr:hypothetical protein [Actinomadura parmotrematis]MBW8487329.1 hypothetical protein [Actinomadura parmotrematis]